jgi:hypothetical protein
MQNNFFGLKLNTVLLLILIILLGVTIWLIKDNRILAPLYVEDDQEQIIDTKYKSVKPIVADQKTNISNLNSIEISLNPWTTADNNKTFTVNKGDTIIVESGNYTDGGFKSENINYDKSMLVLKNHSVTKCDPLITGCSPSDIFEFMPIKSGTTLIQRAHYRTFSSERTNLTVTIKIN